MNENIYAYMRVSTEEQDLSRQENAIKEWSKLNELEIPGYNIYSDKISGKTFKRIQYTELKNKLQKDDILLVKELDRFGRNWDAIKEEWEVLSQKGVKIVIIDMPMLSANPNETIDNRLIRETMFNMLCYVAQKERDKISERTKEGLQEARKRLKKENRDLGRPVKITKEKYEKLKQFYPDTTLTLKDISEKIDISVSQISNMARKLIEDGKLQPRKPNAFGVKNGQGKGSYVKKGYTPHNKKLDEEQEKEMLKDYFENNFSLKQIQEKYKLYPTSQFIIYNKAIEQGLYEPKRKRN